MNCLRKILRNRGRALACLVTLALAGASPAWAADPTVDSALPAIVDQGLTVNVTIGGSGFARGAVAKFYVTGTTDPGGITVNSTTYKTTKQLIANITVASAATIDKFDIEVINQDTRKGKGIELFKVNPKAPTTYTLTELLPVADPGYQVNSWDLSDNSLAEGDCTVAKTYSNTLNPSLTCATGFQAAVFDAAGAPPTVSPLFVDPASIYPSSIQGGSPSGVYAAGKLFRESANPNQCSWYTNPMVWENVGGSWVPHVLDFLPGSNHATATDVIDAGTAVGSSWVAGLLHPVAWSKTPNDWDPPIDLIAPVPGCNGLDAPRGINSTGLVVGNAVGCPTGSDSRAVVWSCGLTSCSAPVVLPLGAFASTFAFHINDDGDVVGRAGGRAILWKYDGVTWTTPLDLGALPSQTSATGFSSIRLNGEATATVVGSAALSNGTTVAFRWREGTGMLNLNALSVKPSAFNVDGARAISATGAISGSGSLKVSKTSYLSRGFVLTP